MPALERAVRRARRRRGAAADRPRHRDARAGRARTAGCPRSCPSCEVARATYDKYEAHLLLQRLGCPRRRRCCPRRTSTRSHYPVMVKPRRGSGARSIHLAHDPAQARFFVDYVRRAGDGPARDGRPRAVDRLPRRPRRALPERDPAHDARVARRASRSRARWSTTSELIELGARDDGGARRYAGPATIQVFRDPDIGVGITDVNTRFGGAFPAPVYAALPGRSYPELIVAHGARARPSSRTSASSTRGMTFTRYYWQLELDERLRPTGRDIVPGGPPRAALQRSLERYAEGPGARIAPVESSLADPAAGRVRGAVRPTADLAAPRTGPAPPAPSRPDPGMRGLRTEPARACANCGAALDAGQDWCLQCGAGGARQPRPASPGWRSARDRARGRDRARAGRRRGRVCRTHQSPPQAAVASSQHRRPGSTVRRAPATTSEHAHHPPRAPRRWESDDRSNPSPARPNPRKSRQTASTPTLEALTPDRRRARTPAQADRGPARPNRTPTAAARPPPNSPRAILLDTNAASHLQPVRLPDELASAIRASRSTAKRAPGGPLRSNRPIAPKMAEGLLIDLKSARRRSAIGRS